ncbi:TPA: DUF1722 domain-containing protein [Streptococcus suis]
MGKREISGHGSLSASLNTLRQLFKGNVWSVDKELEFERLLAEALAHNPSIKTFRTASQHIWGYFKKCASDEERERFKGLDLFLESQAQEMHEFLKCMTDKYRPPYLFQSRIIQLDKIQ